eukprot:TRINITY_DN2800_c0_g2_i1.p1 TRINITY_DN2800_c0_g2~~TRINITY_DN2800_c0_g2_i1.p1  ORF type:complete len:118 (-),score=46.07 TRINITY_DN2800_c0_g2_i1:76-429(-)
MIRRPPRSTHCISSAASDVYKRQVSTQSTWDIDDRSIQLILREVQSDSLILALKGASPELREKNLQIKKQKQNEKTQKENEKKQGDVRKTRQKQSRQDNGEQKTWPIKQKKVSKVGQ